MDVDTGIAKKDREAIVEGLSQALADTYALYQKTHAYHWNVHGPRFAQLHEIFATQYNELWLALDDIAERIRALGMLVPPHGALAKRALITADNDPDLNEDSMIRNLVTANEAVVKSARACLRIAEEGEDDSTADLMTARCTAGEKAAWMLRAHLA